MFVDEHFQFVDDKTVMLKWVILIVMAAIVFLGLIIPALLWAERTHNHVMQLREARAWTAPSQR
jgi:hypothetical protein